MWVTFPFDRNEVGSAGPASLQEPELLQQIAEFYFTNLPLVGARFIKRAEVAVPKYLDQQNGVGVAAEPADAKAPPSDDDENSDGFDGDDDADQESEAAAVSDHANGAVRLASDDSTVSAESEVAADQKDADEDDDDGERGKPRAYTRRDYCTSPLNQAALSESGKCVTM